jgi:hypothetical protein
VIVLAIGNVARGRLNCVTQFGNSNGRDDGGMPTLVRLEVVSPLTGRKALLQYSAGSTLAQRTGEHTGFLMHHHLTSPRFRS